MLLFADHFGEDEVHVVARGAGGEHGGVAAADDVPVGVRMLWCVVEVTVGGAGVVEELPPFGSEIDCSVHAGGELRLRCRAQLLHGVADEDEAAIRRDVEFVGGADDLLFFASSRSGGCWWCRSDR